MQAQTGRLLTGAALALATAMVVSLAAAITKYTSEYVSIEQIVLAQYLFCVVIMLPTIYRRGIVTLKTECVGLHLARGVSGWLCFYTYYLALAKIPLVDASLLRNAAPLVVPVLLFFWRGFKMELVRWIPVSIGFVGIGLVLRPEGSGLSFYHLVGLGSAVTLAGSIVTTRVLTLTEPTLRILFYYFSFSALCSIPLALANWQPIPLFTLPLMGGIGLSIWLTMYLYTKAYSYGKASVISPISYTGVLFTGLLGWLIWDQVPEETALIGAVLIISGGIGSLYLGRDRESPAAGSQGR
jgi:drug/metabolite transporter (DMT)-like permease